MTVAYWCILFSAYLPIIWISSAKFAGRDFGPEQNRSPRDYLEKLEGWRQRAHWAQLNGFEAFLPFAAAVIIAHLQGVAQNTLDTLALTFILFRVMHGVFYIMNLGYWRSLAWFGSTLCVIGIFITSAL